MRCYRVQLFAGARESIGQDWVEFAWEQDSAATVGELKARLANEYPALNPWIKRSILAVDRHYASDDRLVHPSQELALIPPVSGG